MGVSTIFNYDIQALTLDLVKVMRIQDWDFFIRIVSGAGMAAEGFDINTKGICSRDTRHNCVMIHLNHENNEMEEEYDHETSTGWLYTLVHELYHVVISSFDDHVDSVLEFVPDENTRRILSDTSQTEKEYLVNKLTKIFFNVVSESDLKEILQKHKLKNKGTSFEEELAVLMKKYEVKGDDNGKQDTQ